MGDASERRPVSSARTGTPARLSRAAQRRSSLQRQLALAAAVVAFALLLLVALGIYGALHDPPIPWSVLAVDVSEQVHMQGYAGIIEKMSWFLWTMAGTAGLLGAVILWRGHCRNEQLAFLVAATVLTGLLLVDDVVMLHERSGHEELLYAVYGLAFLFLLLRYRPQYLALAVLAGGLLALSILMDEIPEIWSREYILQFRCCYMEDGAKLMGTALWATFMFSSALAASRAVERPERAVHDAQVHKPD